jgi:hypothetical protein
MNALISQPGRRPTAGQAELNRRRRSAGPGGPSGLPGRRGGAAGPVPDGCRVRAGGLLGRRRLENRRSDGEAVRPIAAGATGPAKICRRCPEPRPHGSAPAIFCNPPPPHPSGRLRARHFEKELGGDPHFRGDDGAVTAVFPFSSMTGKRRAAGKSGTGEGCDDKRPFYRSLYFQVLVARRPSDRGPERHWVKQIIMPVTADVPGPWRRHRE